MDESLKQGISQRKPAITQCAGEKTYARPVPERTASTPKGDMSPNAAILFFKKMPFIPKL
jgi:hypothetical protein